MRLITGLLITSYCLLGSCASVQPDEAVPEIKVGAERLFSDYYHLVENQRAGLITNHSAVVGDEHIIDFIHQDSSIELTALFGPEHGIRGTADAGEFVRDDIDERTGVPVYSLYGEISRPTMEMLENVDILIFDIQDVGTRFYTYPATMGRAMQSAAEADIPFLVLDRPNPLGGNLIEGHIREDQYQSVIGQYPTPVTHGMTVGELARMIKGQQWHEGLEDLQLHVAELEGWNRDMLWTDTGLGWIPPSPNIPDVETAFIYPGTCFMEGTNASEGRGTFSPFLQVGSQHTQSDTVAKELNSRALPGLRFHPVEFTPASIQGMSLEPKLLGIPVYGVRLEITDAEAVEPVAAGLHILQVIYENLPAGLKDDFFNERGMQLRAGNDDVLKKLQAGASVSSIMNWTDDVEKFKKQRKPYLIYL